MIDINELRQNITMYGLEATCADDLISLLDRLEASEQEVIEEARLNGMGSEREASLMARLEAAEKDNQRKQKRIEQLEYALRAMTKTYKSVAYAQWPAEMHLANEVLEESK